MLGTRSPGQLPDLPTPLVEPPVAAFVPSKPRPRTLRGLERFVWKHARVLSVIAAFAIGFAGVAVYLMMRGSGPTAPVVAPAVVEPPTGPAERRAPEPRVKIATIVGKGPCVISVVTDPPNALVYVQGWYAGRSPIDVRGGCVTKRVTAARPRFITTTQKVTAVPNKNVSVDITLGRRQHTVLIKTFPPAAEVKFGGRSFGYTPTYVKVPGNTPVEIEITRPGFETVMHKMTSSEPVGGRVWLELKRKRAK